MARSISAGPVVVFPNREKARSQLANWLVVLLLLVSVVLMLLVTVGGWSKLQGLKPLDIAWVVVYLILAFYVGARWSRGALTISAGLGILLLGLALIAGFGLGGTSWFDRSSVGFAAPHSLFGETGLSAQSIGVITLLIAPVQLALIGVSMIGFSQSWNLEIEIPEDEASRRQRRPPRPRSAKPASA